MVVHFHKCVKKRNMNCILRDFLQINTALGTVETYMMKSSELIDNLFFLVYRYKMKDSTIGKNNYTNILGKWSIFFWIITLLRNYYFVYHYEDFSDKIYKWIKYTFHIQ